VGHVSKEVVSDGPKRRQTTGVYDSESAAMHGLCSQSKTFGGVTQEIDENVSQV
jgi:hypothetical protein